MIKFLVDKLFSKRITVALIAILIGCNQHHTQKKTFTIHLLPKETIHPNYGTEEKPLDEKGIPIFNFNGNNIYHPVLIAQRGLDFIRTYYITQQAPLLDSAKHCADAIVQHAVDTQQSLFFPYEFDFALHGIEEETLKAPWYSAMAQGQALSLFVRLFEESKDSSYLNYADKTFNSFKINTLNTAECVIFIDKYNDLWFEEYPMKEPTHALNGFNFAIYGIYDYYRIHPENKEVKTILNKSINTVYNNIELYRVKNDLSYYCLKHKVQDEYYHSVHIEQLTQLFNITHDSLFLKTAQVFLQDGNKYKKNKSK